MYQTQELRKAPAEIRLATVGMGMVGFSIFFGGVFYLKRICAYLCVFVAYFWFEVTNTRILRISNVFLFCPANAPGRLVWSHERLYFTRICSVFHGAHKYGDKYAQIRNKYITTRVFWPSFMLVNGPAESGSGDTVVSTLERPRLFSCSCRV